MRTGWIIFGMLGPREAVLIAVLALVFYGRSGMLRSRPARWLRPWRNPPGGASRQASSAKPAGWPGDRTFWFLAVIAATAVAAWIVTRTLILGAPAVSH